MLVQIDGSQHDWLEDRGPRLALLAAIDDATSQILAAVFRPTENFIGYCLLMEQLLTHHGSATCLASGFGSWGLRPFLGGQGFSLDFLELLRKDHPAGVSSMQGYAIGLDIVGGGVAEAARDLFVNGVRVGLREVGPAAQVAALTVEAASLGNWAGTIGAASAVLRQARVE